MIQRLIVSIKLLKCLSQAPRFELQGFSFVRLTVQNEKQIYSIHMKRKAENLYI